MNIEIQELLVRAHTLLSIADFDEGVKINEVEKIKTEILQCASKPLRNCDVGTAEEQAERHDKYCERFVAEGCGASTNDCIACFARWSQMPCEEVK